MELIALCEIDIPVSVDWAASGFSWQWVATKAGATKQGNESYGEKALCLYLKLHTWSENWPSLNRSECFQQAAEWLKCV